MFDRGLANVAEQTYETIEKAVAKFEEDFRNCSEQ